MTIKKYGQRRTVPHRRKRESRTNYKKRLALLKSGENRLVIRKANNTVTMQLVEYSPAGDKTLVSACSTELRKLGWKMHTGNMTSAYLTGILIGVKAKKKKIGQAVLDLGLQTPNKGGKLFSALKGAVDAGMQIPHDAEVLPGMDRISGKHVAEYAAKIKSDKARYEKQFSRYLKEKADPEQVTKMFEEMKKKILAS
jgi:large subunit ribosomal protein L18